MREALIAHCESPNETSLLCGLYYVTDTTLTKSKNDIHFIKEKKRHEHNITIDKDELGYQIDSEAVANIDQVNKLSQQRIL